MSRQHDEGPPDWLVRLCAEADRPDENDIAELAWGAGSSERRAWTRARIADGSEDAAALAVETSIARGSVTFARRLRAAAIIIVALLPASLWLADTLASQKPALTVQAGLDVQLTVPLPASDLAAIAGLGLRGTPARTEVSWPADRLVGEPQEIRIALDARRSDGLSIRILRHESDAVLGRFTLPRDQGPGLVTLRWPKSMAGLPVDAPLRLELVDADGAVVDQSVFEIGLRDRDVLLRALEAAVDPVALERVANAAWRKGFRGLAVDALTRIPSGARSAYANEFLAAASAVLGQAAAR